MVLTQEQRRNEKIKCAMSPLYYLNTYGHVFDAKQKKVTPMRCFEYQKRCINDFHKYQNNIVLKSRQTGLSVVTAGYVAWRLMFRYEERILIIANDGAGARRFLATVKQFIDYTPDWLRPEDAPTNNQTKLQFSNGSWVEAKASSPNAGRGEALTMLILDETAFIKDDDAIWMGAGMALSATKGKCIMISTPNGAAGLYHRTWVAAINKENDFNSLSVHWTENPQSSEGLVWRKDPSTGKDVPWSPWYEGECKRLSYDAVKIAQELDLSFEGSKYLAIDGALVERYTNAVRGKKPSMFIHYDFLFKGTPQAGSFVTNETNFHVFKKPEPGKSYIVACDVSRGDGKDYSTIQILDTETLEQVAEYREKIGVDLFPYLIDWVGRVYNNAFVVVEANTFGLGVGYDLRDKLQYKRLFYSKNTQEMHVRTHDYKIDIGVEIPGFQSTKTSRPAVIKSIVEHLREGGVIINSQRLMAEMSTFVMVGDKPQAEKGYNDDLIMAYGIALYVRDTAYMKVSATSNMYKNMLDAMTMNSNSSFGVTQENGPKKDIDTPPGGGGLFFGSGDISDDEDLSWLTK